MQNPALRHAYSHSHLLGEIVSILSPPACKPSWPHKEDVALNIKRGVALCRANQNTFLFEERYGKSWWSGINLQHFTRYPSYSNNGPAYTHLSFLGTQRNVFFFFNPKPEEVRKTAILFSQGQIYVASLSPELSIVILNICK